LASAGWDPAAGFAAYEERMRSFVEANQEIGRMHVDMLLASPGPDAEPAPEPDMEALMAVAERAINGVDLPDYAGVPDSRAATTGARPR
jgi:hypothetical protein